MSPRKLRILGITGIRADYDLLKEFYRRLIQEGHELSLLVTGAHLSHRFGHTVDTIIDDGFSVAGTVMSLFDADSPYARAKTFAAIAQGAADLVASYQPDLIVFPGDREEVLAAASVGTYMEIPTLHFFAGDHTRDGHADNPVRHAASKLATVHFVTLDLHRQRLIRMGEEPRRIFVTGNPRLDTFASIQPGSEEEVIQTLGISADHYALVIFHPIAQEREHAARIMTDIISELRSHDLGIVIGAPNSDPGHEAIFRVLEKEAQSDDVHVYRSIPTELFIKVYKNARLIAGNSSSGIIESASVPIPAVNVGLRQKGRHAARNVIFVDSDTKSISQGISRALSTRFRESLRGLVNPYGDGHSAKRAAALVDEIDFRNLLLKQADPLDIPVP